MALFRLGFLLVLYVLIIMSTSNVFVFIALLHTIRQSAAFEELLAPIQLNEDPTTRASTTKQGFFHFLGALKEKVVKTQPQFNHEEDTMEYDSLDDIQYIDEDAQDSPLVRGKKNVKEWDHWGKWSDCSVTCGVGKTTRWRHCVSEECASGEKEAQIKTCTMKPCL